MRFRYVVLLVVLTTLLPLFALRGHIRDLLEIGRTYSTFHSHLRQHPELLFRYPTAAHQANSIALEESVPRKIHRIHLTNGRPSIGLKKYATAIGSCQQLHPEWDLHVWTDQEGESFIAEHYPDIFPHYIGYRQNIQRANILRYALLHHFGGVYLDLDVTCRVALDAPLGENGSVPALTHLPLVTPGAYPAGVNNAFILARAGHPFLAELLDRVPSRDMSWGMPYVENMLSTGCMMFSNAWMVFVLGLQREPQKEDRVYILADEHGEMDAQMLRGRVVTPLFEHGGASSWHGWDAAAIVLIGKHYGYFAAGLLVVLIAVVLGAWRLLRGRRNRQQRRRSSWRNISHAIGRFSMEKRDLHDEEGGLMKDG